MPAIPKAAVAIGLGLFALIAAAAGGEPKTGDRAPIGPIPVPQTDEDLLLIDKTICDCWVGLGNTNNANALRACLVEALHSDVPFPPINGDDTTVFAVWELFTQRVAAFLASENKDEWCGTETVVGGVTPIADPLDLLAEMISQTPQPGYMFQVANGDTLTNVVRAALNSVVPGAGDSSSNRVQYMHCITSGPNWNWPLYASSSFSAQFPSYAGVNGMGLRRAFYPWHENAKVALSQYRMPKKGITTAGSKITGVGSSYAMLWLPPVDPDALDQGVVTCGALEHSDGSSSINPPPELLNLLQGA